LCTSRNSIEILGDAGNVGRSIACGELKQEERCDCGAIEILAREIMCEHGKRENGKLKTAPALASWLIWFCGYPEFRLFTLASPAMIPHRISPAEKNI
jgi:hypothetical protein